MPGGWEEFFRFIGEPYEGAMWPMEDKRNFFEVLLPKLKAASEKFDMIPCPQHKGATPSEWTGQENKLPGKPEPYFLKNATGPAYEVGGHVVRPLATTAESNGRFSVGAIEASKQHHQHSLFAESGKSLRFDTVHHAFLVVQGSVKFDLESSGPSTLPAGELIYVPKGTAFKFEVVSRFAKLYVFANGGGLLESIIKVGKEHTLSILPEQASKVDASSLEGTASESGFALV